jgi:hypothetical protein
MKFRDLIAGDVLRYAPSQNHCREGMAFVTESGNALDTYWGPEGDSNSHALTDRELSTAKVVFNVAEFTVLDRYSAASGEKWETYSPDDRERVTSQHGLQELLFVRRGARPNLGTQIDNARRDVGHAEDALRGAQQRLDSVRARLYEMLECEGSGVSS